jgi:formylmethanofuran dehydrogenase subunit E
LIENDSAKSTANTSNDIVVKCSKCNRTIKNSYKWVGDHKNILCEGCYKDLAFPLLHNRYNF